MEEIKEGNTATAPDGVIHQLRGRFTRCGQNADGWSRAITMPQRLGLALFCEACQLPAGCNLCRRVGHPIDQPCLP